VPALSKTTDAAIVAAARALVETAGDQFSMAAVANAVGVQTPSLYKRFADRRTLLARVRTQAYVELRAAIAGLATLEEMAQAYRAFALAHPHLYGLMFVADETPDEELQRARLAAVAPVLALLAPLTGGDRALDAARTLTAFLHGHVSMLLAGAFQLGGDVDAAFAYGVEALLAGVRDPSRRSENDA
jgi:AcrR family transcriptional regulator